MCVCVCAVWKSGRTISLTPEREREKENELKNRKSRKSHNLSDTLCVGVFVCHCVVHS